VPTARRTTSVRRGAAICSEWISASRDAQNDSSTATPISALAYSDSPRLPSMLSIAGRTEVLM